MKKWHEEKNTNPWGAIPTQKQMYDTDSKYKVGEDDFKIEGIVFSVL